VGLLRRQLCLGRLESVTVDYAGDSAAARNGVNAVELYWVDAGNFVQ